MALSDNDLADVLVPWLWTLGNILFDIACCVGARAPDAKAEGFDCLGLLFKKDL